MRLIDADSLKKKFIPGDDTLLRRYDYKEIWTAISEEPTIKPVQNKVAIDAYEAWTDSSIALPPYGGCYLVTVHAWEYNFPDEDIEHIYTAPAYYDADQKIWNKHLNDPKQRINAMINSRNVGKNQSTWISHWMPMPRAAKQS